MNTGGNRHDQGRTRKGPENPKIKVCLKVFQENLLWQHIVDWLIVPFEIFQLLQLSKSIQAVFDIAVLYQAIFVELSHKIVRSFE